MLKKTITYVDYNGTTKTQDFFFNLSKAEITKMEMSVNGGLVNKIETIAAAQDGSQMMEMFEKIILSAYGEKTPDGRFMKSPDISESFSWTAAYDVLFMELCTDPAKATYFINNIVPKPVGDPPKS